MYSFSKKFIKYLKLHSISCSKHFQEPYFGNRNSRPHPVKIKSVWPKYICKSLHTTSLLAPVTELTYNHNLLKNREPSQQFIVLLLILKKTTPLQRNTHSIALQWSVREEQHLHLLQAQPTAVKKHCPWGLLDSLNRVTHSFATNPTHSTPA